jgi:hypothetical protein
VIRDIENIMEIRIHDSFKVENVEVTPTRVDPMGELVGSRLVVSGKLRPLEVVVRARRKLYESKSDKNRSDDHIRNACTELDVHSESSFSVTVVGMLFVANFSFAAAIPLL